MYFSNILILHFELNNQFNKYFKYIYTLQIEFKRKKY